MRSGIVSACIIILLAGLTACTVSASPAPTLRPQDLVTQLPTNTPSHLPPTLTLSVSPTKTPTPTRTITTTALPFIEAPKGIVYRTDNGEFVTEGSGQTTTIFEFEDSFYYASVSPDGSSILRWDATGQYIVNVDSGSKTMIWPRDGYNLCPFSWINRRPLVLITLLLPEGADPGYSCNHGSPVLLSLDGELTVFDNEGTGWSWPSVSGDGNFIAYDLQGIPFLFNWEQGSKPFDVTSFGFPDSEQVRFKDPSWSPSGEKLAWAYQYSGNWEYGGIIIFNLETKKYAIYEPYTVKDYEDNFPPRIIWNQKETYIVLWHFDSTRGGFRNDMIPLDGSLPRDLGRQVIRWNPTGDLYTIRKSVEDERRWDLYVESPDGSISYPICYGCSGSVLWSPDGTQVLAISGNYEYVLIDIETGNIVRINLPPDSTVVNWKAN